MVDEQLGMALGQRVVLTIPLKPEYVALCRLALTALGNQSGLDEETIADLKLAVTEACSNFIGRAQSTAPCDRLDGAISVEYGLFPDRWVILVRGPGTGLGQEEPREDPFSEGTIGITIISALVDELELLPEADTATLRLVKRL
jgi:anti-sigma regulatory factor (Ser/Thr protein kinase)